jgi:hypothetical protein
MLALCCDGLHPQKREDPREEDEEDQDGSESRAHSESPEKVSHGNKRKDTEEFNPSVNFCVIPWL